MYTLDEDTTFHLPLNFGKWKLYDRDTLIATSYGSKITVYAGFKWDGCDVIGEIYEDANTLHASLLHDVLYATLTSRDIKYNILNLFKADLAFAIAMCMHGSSKLLALLYFLVLITLGLPWKFRDRGYRVVNCE